MLVVFLDGTRLLGKRSRFSLERPGRYRCAPLVYILGPRVGIPGPASAKNPAFDCTAANGGRKGGDLEGDFSNLSSASYAFLGAVRQIKKIYDSVNMKGTFKHRNHLPQACCTVSWWGSGVSGSDDDDSPSTHLLYSSLARTLFSDGSSLEQYSPTPLSYLASRTGKHITKPAPEH
jgi:hypothetical protein